MDSQFVPIRLTFSDLTLGAVDVIPYLQRGDPAAWKKLAIAAVPPARAVQIGDTVAIEVWSDSAAGLKLTDLLRIDRLAQPFSQTSISQMQAFSAIRNNPGGPNFSGPNFGGPNSRPIPTVSGAARAYSPEDAELHLSQVRIAVNDEIQGAPGHSVNATGPLVWFYLPNRGRYILSLAPHPELGFVQAGEVRGGAITFTEGKDKFLLESPVPAATGSAAYFLYVLHDPDWEPTARNQADRPQFGSVAPRELVLLQKK